MFPCVVEVHKDCKHSWVGQFIFSTTAAKPASGSKQAAIANFRANLCWANLGTFPRLCLWKFTFVGQFGRPIMFVDRSLPRCKHIWMPKLYQIDLVEDSHFGFGLSEQTWRPNPIWRQWQLCTFSILSGRLSPGRERDWGQFDTRTRNSTILPSVWYKASQLGRTTNVVIIDCSDKCRAHTFSVTLVWIFVIFGFISAFQASSVCW